jgi:hypothetical protein
MCHHSRRYCLGLAASALLTWAAPGQAAGPVILRIDIPQAEGQAPRTVTFDMAAIKAFAQTTFTSKTPWYKTPVTFTGPLLRDVLAAAKVTQGTTLKATALDEYAVRIPITDAQQYDMVLAHSIDGVTLTPRTKGPLFVVYPYDSQAPLHSVKYYERSIWQLKSLQVE